MFSRRNYKLNIEIVVRGDLVGSVRTIVDECIRHVSEFWEAIDRATKSTYVNLSS